MFWMLDTNAVSDLLRGEAGLTRRVADTRVGTVCLSAVTAAELHYGLARRPGQRALHEAVRQLLLLVPTLPWTEEVAGTYGSLRAQLETGGRSLSALDTMIAAHARHLELTLVSHDRAFAQVPGLRLEDWHA